MNKKWAVAWAVVFVAWFFGSLRPMSKGSLAWH
jgi:hypothetical protein